MIFPIPHGSPAGDIQYHYEDIAFRLADTVPLDTWIKNIIKQEEHTLDIINYIFCSDEYLYNINLEYLNHDTYTDIITFPLSEHYIESDIYISIDRVVENALLQAVSFEQELHRVMIHGVLHLCGYADKTPQEQQLMTSKENEALTLLPKYFSPQ